MILDAPVFGRTTSFTRKGTDLGEGWGGGCCQRFREPKFVHPETKACQRGHFAKRGVNIVRGKFKVQFQMLLVLWISS